MRRPILSVLAVAAVTAGSVVVLATPALAAPAFQLPFPCGQTWSGNSSASSAHVSYEIDFNRGASATADLRDTVVASASGTVVIAANQGSTNGYGNLVKIDHGSSYFSYYAHLSSIAVVAGQYVSGGQVLGGVGDTTRPGSDVSPHLHYEVRSGGSSQSNVIRAIFDGSTFGYPVDTVTSDNCSTSYDPAEVCGSGFYPVDTARLSTAGTTNLMWNGTSNCVVTLKVASLGTPTATSAYLEPNGSSRTTDSGSFGYYAGPVVRTAPGCVRWGGSAGGTTYNSPLEHC